MVNLLWRSIWER